MEDFHHCYLCSMNAAEKPLLFPRPSPHTPRCCGCRPSTNSLFPSVSREDGGSASLSGQIPKGPEKFILSFYFLPPCPPSVLFPLQRCWKARHIFLTFIYPERVNSFSATPASRTYKLKAQNLQSAATAFC